MFGSFPTFTPVCAETRDHYQEFMRRFPPLSDLSFTTLQLWWNVDGRLRISSLNDNAVISYQAAGRPEESGLSLIGTTDVPASLDRIFAYLRQRQLPLRLVHVPEFAAALAPPQRYDVVEEPDYHEYLVPVSNLYPLESCPARFRYKVRKMISSVGNATIDVRRLDLNLVENRRLLLDRARSWPSSKNDPDSAESRALATSIVRAGELEMHNLCLFVDGELEGFKLFHISHDGKYMIMNHAKSSRRYPHLVAYLEHVSGQEAERRGIAHQNLEMDLGIAGLRTHKSELRPTGFFKKFQISPGGGQTA